MIGAIITVGEKGKQQNLERHGQQLLNEVTKHLQHAFGEEGALANIGKSLVERLRNEMNQQSLTMQENVQMTNEYLDGIRRQALSAGFDATEGRYTKIGRDAYRSAVTGFNLATMGLTGARGAIANVAGAVADTLQLKENPMVGGAFAVGAEIIIGKLRGAVNALRRSSEVYKSAVKNDGYCRYLRRSPGLATLRESAQTI